MSSRVDVGDKERAELEKLVRTTADKRVRERCQAVLMAAQGLTQPQIAKALVTSMRTVQRHLERFRRAGLTGVVPGKAPGKARLIPAQLESVVIEWVRQGPRQAGAPYANWTHQKLADWLRHEHAVAVARSTMGEFCRQHGIRPYRPSYRFLRADAQRQQQALKELAQKKSVPSGASWCC